MKIIKINAMWCPGCLITKSIWQEIEKEYPSHEYINLDYDLDEEEIQKVELLKHDETDTSYSFRFLIKKVESIGEFQKY